MEMSGKKTSRKYFIEDDPRALSSDDLLSDTTPGRLKVKM